MMIVVTRGAVLVIPVPIMWLHYRLFGERYRPAFHGGVSQTI